MISDYFSLTSKEKKSLKTESSAENEIKKRIDDLKLYISYYITDKWILSKIKSKQEDGFVHITYYESEKWLFSQKINLETGKASNFYVSKQFWDSIISNWTENKKIKLDEQDWRYILYMILKEEGQDQLSYHNCTLSICMDKPPVIKV